MAATSAAIDFSCRSSLMRILFISHFFPPTHTAGTENYTLGLAKAFLARGHQVDVICAEGWHQGSGYWNGVSTDIQDGITVHRLHLHWAKAHNPNRVLYDSPRVEGWLDQFLAANRPDVVHVTSTYTLGVGVLRAAHRRGIPLVLTLMDFWFMCPRTVLVRGDGTLCDGLTTAWECSQCLLSSSHIYNRSKTLLPTAWHAALWKAVPQWPILARQRGARGYALDMVERKSLMKEILGLPRVIISHSRVVQEFFTRAQLSDRVVHLPNGHDLRWISSYTGKSPSPEIRFGFMGQISEQKGIHLLIDAYRKLNLNGQARLDIWGDLSLVPAYSQRLKQVAGLSNNIHFRGHFARHQLAEVLSQMDVLVVPSMWYENAPLVIQEAFATRTPVIATNLGGMAEAITDEVNGLLFQFGDADDLARQMRRVVEEPSLLTHFEAQIPPVKTIDDEVCELEQLYTKIIDAG